jgi:hypothetical protein
MALQDYVLRLTILKKSVVVKILGNQIFDHTQGDIHLYISVVRSSGNICYI